LPIACRFHRALPSVRRHPAAEGAGWIHEIKHDGYRLMAQRHGVGGRLLTRNGNDWTDRYPAVVAAIYALRVKSCLIDGEIPFATRGAFRSLTC